MSKSLNIYKWAIFRHEPHPVDLSWKIRTYDNTDSSSNDHLKKCISSQLNPLLLSRVLRKSRASKGGCNPINLLQRRIVLFLRNGTIFLYPPVIKHGLMKNGPFRKVIFLFIGEFPLPCLMTPEGTHPFFRVLVMLFVHVQVFYLWRFLRVFLSVVFGSNDPNIANSWERSAQKKHQKSVDISLIFLVGTPHHLFVF